MTLRLHVNGRDHALDVPADTMLLYVLRNDLGLNGPKYGCGLGECGACAVLVDGVVARSCCVPAGIVQGREVVTLEGLGKGLPSPGALHPVQAAFIEEQAAQCGYCLNGMIVAAVALLAGNAAPDEGEIKEALRYNLCRCGAHYEIVRAVQRAASLMAAA